MEKEGLRKGVILDSLLEMGCELYYISFHFHVVCLFVLLFILFLSPEDMEQRKCFSRPFLQIGAAVNFIFISVILLNYWFYLVGPIWYYVDDQMTGFIELFVCVLFVFYICVAREKMTGVLFVFSTTYNNTLLKHKKKHYILPHKIKSLFIFIVCSIEHIFISK